MITYNHEPYIAQAISSVMMQEGNFSIELVIGEDNSKDGTLAICNQLRDQFPGQIKVLTSETNIGMMNNFLRTHAACDGDYIAFIEGDDFWTDTKKLQKQLSFLEEHPDFILCFHNVLVDWVNTGRTSDWAYQKKIIKDAFVTEDLLSNWFIPTASVMARNSTNFTFPEWFQFCKSGDIPYLLLFSLKGRIKYLNERMSVYRVHDKGISHTHNGYDKIIAMIFIYENFNIYSGYKYAEGIKEAIIREITYHLPKPVADEPDGPEEKNTLVNRFYRRIKKGLLHYGS
jgi:glycosyltransferase involved in cell wall biosynthesis